MIHTVYCTLGALLFSMYIVFDTQVRAVFPYPLRRSHATDPTASTSSPKSSKRDGDVGT